MSGHSKWSTIKHRKAIKDRKKGVLFSRLSKDIALAVSEGGSDDPGMNPRLRMVLDKARAANMPTDRISKAIDRGAGKTGSAGFQEVIYEGYGPSGIAVIAVVRTDNRQRTGATVRNIYERAGGSLGGPGSAAFLFDKQDGKFVAKVKLPIQPDLSQKLTLFLEELRLINEVLGVYTNANLINAET